MPKYVVLSNLAIKNTKAIFNYVFRYENKSISIAFITLKEISLIAASFFGMSPNRELWTSLSRCNRFYFPSCTQNIRGGTFHQFMWPVDSFDMWNGSIYLKNQSSFQIQAQNRILNGLSIQRIVNCSTPTKHNTFTKTKNLQTESLHPMSSASTL